MEADLPIAFVGTFPPRRCGIATFTSDLAAAVAGASEHVQPMVLALTDPEGEYAYPADVKYEIRQGVRGDYARAAEFVNYSDVRLVSLQHEYGIFGGDDGVYVLDFLAALRVPAIPTLHTVLKHPSSLQKSIVQKMAKQCAALVVMSRVAADLLASSYDISGSKVHVIAHGIPALQPRDRQVLKAKFGAQGRRMLLTFGLLSPNKGIETVIRALPKLIAAFPDTVYFVVGATHPVVRRRQGEAYRTTLEREAEALGVREHVVFRDQYVSSAELSSYLQAADIFISPYLNEAQVTSGALSYAMGAGTAVVSTPYWHARELLADERGALFPFGDSEALGRTLAELLGSGSKLERARAASLEFTRAMVWPHIGEVYLRLATDTITALGGIAPALRGGALSVPARPVQPGTHRASSLPDLRLDHLLRMTDDTGIIQHATYSVPARRTGYCVDDNARALIVALLADRVNSTPETRRLVVTYLSYLQCSQDDDGHFRNFMTYGRTFVPGPPSDDCIGRAVWALGTTLQLAQDDGCRLLAREMLDRALAQTSELGPRGTAITLLGLTSLLAVEPGAGGVCGLVERLADKLVKAYQDQATDDWRWFEPGLTYDNAMIPLGLFNAYVVTGERASLRVAREALEFLEGVCFREDQLFLIGNAGWHRRGGAKSEADEQAIDAAAFVLAFRGAYLATFDHHYLRRMRQSFAWFLGANRLGLPLYDFASAGCRDGLGALHANQNQGAESTICFLMSLLKMLELAGEGLEHADLHLAATQP
jgi:glycosyltransferase involved in cell wall biosynthesis